MREQLFVFALALAVALVMSYVLGSLGEPQSLWLWRDILGIVE